MEASPKGSGITQNLNKEESSSTKDGKLETKQLVKILGIYWEVIQDDFRYDLSKLIEYAEALPASKRSVLRLSTKILDPIGLLTPFTVNMTVLFRGLCVEQVKWDETLEREALAKWKTFINDLNALKSIRVPPCYANYSPTQSAVCSYQIHGFSDASERGYGAVVYLRTEFSNGQHHDIQDESSPEQMSVSAQIKTAGSCTASPTSILKAANVTTRSSN